MCSIIRISSVLRSARSRSTTKERDHEDSSLGSRVRRDVPLRRRRPGRRCAPRNQRRPRHEDREGRPGDRAQLDVGRREEQCGHRQRQRALRLRRELWYRPRGHRRSRRHRRRSCPGSLREVSPNQLRHGVPERHHLLPREEGLRRHDGRVQENPRRRSRREEDHRASPRRGVRMKQKEAVRLNTA